MFRRCFFFVLFFKLFDTLKVFLEYFFEKGDFEKISRRQKKHTKFPSRLSVKDIRNYSVGKELDDKRHAKLPSGQRVDDKRHAKLPSGQRVDDKRHAKLPNGQRVGRQKARKTPSGQKACEITQWVKRKTFCPLGNFACLVSSANFFFSKSSFYAPDFGKVEGAYCFGIVRQPEQILR